jgi:hypothetical protein
LLPITRRAAILGNCAGSEQFGSDARDPLWLLGVPSNANNLRRNTSVFGAAERVGGVHNADERRCGVTYLNLPTFADISIVPGPKGLP